MKLTFERLRLILKDGEFVVRVEGGDLDAEIVVLHCGDSLDLTLPIGGAIPVTVGDKARAQPPKPRS